MKASITRIIGTTIILISMTSQLFSAEEKEVSEASPNLFNLSLQLGIGFPVSGEQAKVAKDGLSPRPDYMAEYFYGANIMILPGTIGFEAGFTRNLMRAVSSQAKGGFSAFVWDTGNAGVLLSFQINPESQNKTFFVVGAGINYTSLDVAQQFKDALIASAAAQNLTISFNPDRATGIGGYFKLGGLIYLSESIFFEAWLKVTYVNVRYPNATKSLDNIAIDIPLGIGYSF